MNNEDRWGIVYNNDSLANPLPIWKLYFLAIGLLTFVPPSDFSQVSCLLSVRPFFLSLILTCNTFRSNLGPVGQGLRGRRRKVFAIVLLEWMVW